MANASLDSFKRIVEKEWPAKQDRDAKAFLIRTARAGHDKIMRDQVSRSGVAPEWDAYANSPGKPIQAVVLPGPIVFKYRYHREIVDQLLRALRGASPVDSGDYVRGHALFVNRQAVDTLPKNFKPSDEIMIANPVPYARRLEIGKTKSGRSFVMQVPDRIYERVAKGPVARKYSKVAVIRFGYVDLGGYVTKGKLSATYGARTRAGQTVQRKRRQRPGSRVQAPAIFLEIHS
jgi:hypothetical protein